MRQKASVKIIIPGDPIPKVRHVKTKKGFAYDPQWELKKRVSRFLEQEIREYYEKDENAIEGHKLSIGNAFEVDWYFYMPIPKSFSQSKKNACKWGLIEHNIKPDRSNLEKFYEDCANNILWKDDCQITSGKVIKKYCSDDKPRTEIHMTPIQEPNEDIKNIISMFSPEDIANIFEDANNLLSPPHNLPKIASFLSKNADKHSKKLSQITKNYHGYWKKFETNSSLNI
jgi:Holliday junction resolvase RusA-like endonuclease